MIKKRRKIRFIINPVSGIGRQRKIEKLVEEYLDTRICEYDISYTQHKGHGIELSREAAEKKYDIVVAVGGDGSINETSKGIIGSETALGIIPTGSGNGLAHFLNLPFNLVKAVEMFNSPKFMNIDTATLNGHLFVSIAGIGFDGVVAQKFSKVSIRGFWGYFRTVIEEYGLYEPQKYRVQIDGEMISTRALSVVFANTNQYGFNAIIAPEAKINDGLIDVCILQRLPMITAPLLAQLMFLKQLDKTNFMEVRKVKELHIRTTKNNIANIDGESIDLGKEVFLKLNPASLKLAVPFDFGSPSFLEVLINEQKK